MKTISGLLGLVGLAAVIAAHPVHAAETLKIGVVNQLTGPQAEGGRFTVNGTLTGENTLTWDQGLLASTLNGNVDLSGLAKTGTGTLVVAASSINVDLLDVTAGTLPDTVVAAMQPTAIRTRKPKEPSGPRLRSGSCRDPTVLTCRP